MADETYGSQSLGGIMTGILSLFLVLLTLQANPKYSASDARTAEVLMSLRQVALRDCNNLDSMKAFQSQFTQFTTYVRKEYKSEVNPATMELVPAVKIEKE